MIAQGGTGRPALEILRGCQDLDIDYTDSTANNLQVLEQLLDNKKVQWYQVIEGKLSELLEYHLPDDESKQRLLQEKGNTISYWQADYKNMRPFLTGYNIVVIDFRSVEIGFELRHITSKLKDGGLLILGSINAINPVTSTGRCSPNIPDSTKMFLERWFEEIPCEDALESYAHIYKETRNKHQYAVSNFSVWRKKDTNEDIENDDTFTKLVEVDAPTMGNDFEKDAQLLNSYDKFHFGTGLLGVANFPKRMAEVCIEACKRYGAKLECALDAGCGPGGTALDLCSAFNMVKLKLSIWFCQFTNFCRWKPMTFHIHLWT